MPRHKSAEAPHFSVGSVTDRHPPGPSNTSGRIGYIMNISVEPDYRHQGLGRRLTQAAIDWMAEQGIYYIKLHASEMGRSLYEEMGFGQQRDEAKA